MEVERIGGFMGHSRIRTDRTWGSSSSVEGSMGMGEAGDDQGLE